jgi:hypothetical protein
MNKTKKKENRDIILYENQGWNKLKMKKRTENIYSNKQRG